MNASDAVQPVVEINMLVNTNVFEFAYIAIIKSVLPLHIVCLYLKKFSNIKHWLFRILILLYIRKLSISIKNTAISLINLNKLLVDYN